MHCYCSTLMISRKSMTHMVIRDRRHDSCSNRRKMPRNHSINDFIGRYGGEEFAVILPSSSLRNGVKRGRQIKKSIAATHYKHKYENTDTGITLRITVSIGSRIQKRRHSGHGNRAGRQSTLCGQRNRKESGRFRKGDRLAHTSRHSWPKSPASYLLPYTVSAQMAPH